MSDQRLWSELPHGAASLSRPHFSLSHPNSQVFTEYVVPQVSHTGCHLLPFVPSLDLLLPTSQSLDLLLHLFDLDFLMCSMGNTLFVTLTSQGQCEDQVMTVKAHL